MNFKNLFLVISMLFLSIYLSSSIEEKNEINNSQVSSGYVTINGTQLNYMVEGKGKPCFVIGPSIYYPGTFSKQLRDHFRFYFVEEVLSKPYLRCIEDSLLKQQLWAVWLLA